MAVLTGRASLRKYPVQYRPIPSNTAPIRLNTAPYRSVPNNTDRYGPLRRREPIVCSQRGLTISRGGHCSLWTYGRVRPSTWPILEGPYNMRAYPGYTHVLRLYFVRRQQARHAGWPLAVFYTLVFRCVAERGQWLFRSHKAPPPVPLRRSSSGRYPILTWARANLPGPQARLDPPYFSGRSTANPPTPGLIHLLDSDNVTGCQHSARGISRADF